MRPLVCLFFSLVLVLPGSAAEQPFREWTNSEGKKISAKLVGLEDGQITLALPGGREYELDLDSLSQADQDFAEQWQIEQKAKAKLEALGTKLSQPTKVIVESPFDKETPRTRKADLAGWKAGIGEWRIEDGSLIGDEVAEDNHASSLTYRFEATHLVIKAEVQLGTANQIAFACRDTVPPSLHLGRLYITPDKLWIQHMSGIAKTTRAEKLTVKEVDLDPSQWYDVTIEIVGDQYRATVGDEEIEATHSRFADPKGIVALVNKGQGAKFRNVSLWHAEPTE